MSYNRETDDPNIFTDLFTDEKGVTWNILRRDDGSISLYGTMPGESCHLIIYDSLDHRTPSVSAFEVISRLRHIARGIGLLFEAQTTTDIKKGGDISAMRQIMHIAAKDELTKQDAKNLAALIEAFGFEQERAAVLMSNHWGMAEEIIQQWIRLKLLKK